jgi:hypothetical protein
VPYESEVGARARPQVLSVRWLLAIGFGVLLGTTRSLTWPATVLVAVLCLGMGLAGRRALMQRRTDLSSGVDARSAAPWAAAFVLFCLWELAAFLLGNNDAHPTFSILTEGILGWFPARAIAASVWLLVGWEVLEL